MIKTIIPSLLLISAAAAQGADEKLLGFEFGVGYYLVDDRRYDGTDANFGLVLPMGQKFDIVVYHEVGRYYGKQDGARGQAETETTELRFRIPVWESESQGVKLVVGIGQSEISASHVGHTHEEEAPIADLGLQYVVM